MSRADPLLEAALSVTDGQQIDWSQQPDRLGPTDRQAWERLEQISRLATASGLAGAAHDGEPDQPLRRWGPLEIVQRIGGGSYGDVYVARDPRLDRPVALKLLRAPDAVGSDTTTVVGEGHLLARVRHPNVVTVYGAEQINGRAGLWMEFIDGETLETVIRRRGPFAAEEVIETGTDICRALEAVHRAGLLHRDVKAQNVMRERTGRIVLMDFGAGHDARDLVRGERLAGTPAYLAPELLDGQPPSPSSDVFALGVLLYRLATGEFPFPGTSLQAIKAAQQERRLTGVTSRRPGIPRQLGAAIERAISVDPRNRFESAAAFGNALAAAARPRYSGWSRSSPAAGLLIAATAMAMWAAYSAGSEARLRRTRAEPQLRTVWSDPVAGTVHVGSASDDGRLAAAIDPESGALVLRDLVGATTRVLLRRTERGAPEFPALSRDGSEVAYAWRGIDGLELRTARTSGAPAPRTAWTAGSERIDSVVVHDWSPDGRTLLAGFRAGYVTRIGLVDPAVHTAHMIRTVPWSPDSRAAFSRDGSRVALSVPAAKGSGQHDLIVISLSAPPDSEPMLSLEGAPNDVLAGWSPVDDEVLFLSDRDGATGLWGLGVAPDRTPAEPRPLRPNVNGVPLRVAATGALLLAVPISDRDLYLAGVDFESGQVVETPRRVLTRRDGVVSSPAFSPDGQWLAFTTRREGAENEVSLSVVRLDDRTVRTFPLPMLAFIEASWSSASDAVLGAGNRGPEGTGIYEVSLATGEAKLIARDAGSPQAAEPDRLYFRRPLSLPPYELIERSVAAGIERVVFRHEARMSAALSPDGSRIAAVLGSAPAPGPGPGPSPTPRHLVVVSVADGAVHELLTSDRLTFLARWLPDGRSVLVSSGGRLAAVPAGGGEPRWLDLRVVPEPQREEHLDVHPDGRRIAFMAGTTRMELWMLENFLPASRP